MERRLLAWRGDIYQEGLSDRSPEELHAFVRGDEDG
jgi:hypothetical protein